MKNIFMNVARLILVSMLAFGFFACGKKPLNKITLILYNYGAAVERVAAEEGIARFKAKHPNVTVENNFSPITTWADYIQNLAVQSAGGKTPDLIHIATEGVELAVRKNFLLPLDEFVPDDNYATEMFQDIHPRLIESVSVDGKPYLLPTVWNNMLIYYNTTLFKEKGVDIPKNDWTRDDFLETAKKLTSGTQENKIFGLAATGGNFGYSPFFFTNDTSFLSDDMTKSNFNTPAFKESVSFIRDLVLTHRVMPNPQSISTIIYDLFTQGRIGMVTGGRWPIETFKNNNFTSYDVVPWPIKVKRATVLGVGGWGLNPKSIDKKEIAWELVKELTNFETQHALASGGAAIPSRRSVVNTPEFRAEPPNVDAFYDSLDYARVVEAPIFYPELERIFRKYLDLILTGEQSVDQAMSAADKEITEVIKRKKQ